MNENFLLNKKVLVAEDNAINQMVVKHTLLKMGASADMASDGAEAIEKFKKNTYDLILMDIQMPLMDGYETTAYIRNQLKSNIPIIAMTAFALNGEDAKCYECGMNNYVSKPFTIENLGTVIQKVLSLPMQGNANSHILANEKVSIDLNLLYEISENDESYISVMVHTFLENMPVTLKQIDQNLLNQDWNELYKSAHFAKSSLSIIKINGMLEAVAEIEENARHQINLQKIPALVKKINETFLLAEEVLCKNFGVECNS